MAETIKKSPRKYRNIDFFQILKYRLPAPGKVSIMHRVSGVLLFLSLPFSLYLFEQSLTSEISFSVLKGLASHWLAKCVFLLLSWAFLFHFVAGLRHLLMDVHVISTKLVAVKSAKTVLFVSTLLTVVVALKLFGVF